MLTHYQVLFRGRVREGFALAEVKRMAATRLKASPAMIEQIFSGQRVIFKKGLRAEQAQQYLDTLAGLGMAAEMVADAPEGLMCVDQAVTAPAGFDPARIGSNLAHAQALLDRIGAVSLSA